MGHHHFDAEQIVRSRAIRKNERLSGRGAQSRGLGRGPIDPDVELALVAEHRRRLFGEEGVASFRLPDGLLDLNARVEELVQGPLERGREVSPETPE